MSNSLKNKEISALIQLKKNTKSRPPFLRPLGARQGKRTKKWNARWNAQLVSVVLLFFISFFFERRKKNKTNEKRARVRRKTPMATRQSTAEAKSGRRWLVGCRGRRWRHGQWTAWNVAMLFAERDDFEFNKIWFRDGHLGLGSIRRWLTADRPTVH